MHGSAASAACQGADGGEPRRRADHTKERVRGGGRAGSTEGLCGSSEACTAAHSPAGQQRGQGRQGGGVSGAQLGPRELACSQLAIAGVSVAAQAQRGAVEPQSGGCSGHVGASAGPCAMQAQQASGHGGICAGSAQQGGA